MKKHMNRNARSHTGKRGLMRRITAAMRHARKGVHDDRGVAAIEFVLVMPILLILMLGSIEIFLMSMASRKMTRVASTVGDLVTQAKGTLTREIITDYYKVARYILGNFPEENLAISIYTFTRDPDTGNPKLSWKIHLGDYQCQEQEPTLTENQREAMNDGNDLVITYGCYRYQVRIGQIALGNLNLNMKDEVTLRPRQRMTLPCDDCGTS